MPDSHPEVARLVRKALGKAREDRFQTAREFRLAVGEVEEACLSEDSHAPTRVMRSRLNSRAALGELAAGPNWEGQIEDPATCVDDEVTKADDPEGVLAQRVLNGQRDASDASKRGARAGVDGDGRAIGRARGVSRPPAITDDASDERQTVIRRLPGR